MTAPICAACCATRRCGQRNLPACAQHLLRKGPNDCRFARARSARQYSQPTSRNPEQRRHLGRSEPHLSATASNRHLLRPARPPNALPACERNDLLRQPLLEPAHLLPLISRLPRAIGQRGSDEREEQVGGSEPFHDDVPRLEALAAGRALIQVSFRSLAGTFGRTIKRTAWTLVEEGIADLVATDCHSPRELPKIVGPVLEELHRRVSTPKLARLLSGTPNRLLTAE
jgi:hypothetical protein